MPAHSGLLALGLPWESGQQHKRDMSRVRNAAAFIVLTRDSGEGHITVDKYGEPIISYWPNALDRQHLVRGMQEVTRVALAGGAHSVGTTYIPRLMLEGQAQRSTPPVGDPAAEPFRGGPAQRRPSEPFRGGRPGERETQAFLREIERRGIVPNHLILGTAHQMGTCRLGGSPKTSVADPYGEVYGVRGLFIADASAFPSASGVNPMLTTMAIAYRVAQQIKTRA
jgi:choline dehydrogenase-like flavoprotein